MSDKRNRVFTLLREILSIAIILLIGACAVIFTTLFLDVFSYPLIEEHKNLFTIIAVLLISALTIVTLILYKVKQGIIYKICYLSIILIAVAVFMLYLMQQSGFLDKIDNIEEFRDYIDGFGGGAVFLFILIQFLTLFIIKKFFIYF